MKYVLFFYISTFCSVCAVPNVAVFAVPTLRTFLVCCSGTDRVISIGYQSSLLFLVYNNNNNNNNDDDDDDDDNNNNNGYGRGSTFVRG